MHHRLPIVLAALFLLGTTSLAIAPTLREDLRYAEPESCAECHQKIVDDWSRVVVMSVM